MSVIEENPVLVTGVTTQVPVPIVSTSKIRTCPAVPFCKVVPGVVSNPFKFPTDFFIIVYGKFAGFKFVELEDADDEAPTLPIARRDD